MSLPRRRYCLGFGRKGVIFPSAHTKPAVLNLPQPRYCHDSQRSGVIWPSVQAESPFYQLLPSSGLSLVYEGRVCKLLKIPKCLHKLHLPTGSHMLDKKYFGACFAIRVIQFWEFVQLDVACS